MKKNLVISQIRIVTAIASTWNYFRAVCNFLILWITLMKQSDKYLSFDCGYAF